jgi:hypothetical protein
MGNIKFTVGISTGFLLVKVITVDRQKPLHSAARFGGTAVLIVS